MRLIDADELIKKFLNVCRTEFENENKCMADENVIALIHNAPTVEEFTNDDVKTAIKEGHQVGYEMAKAKFERPTGEWIKEGQEEGQVYPTICSNCHRQSPCDDEGYYLTEFCPYCGADMRGGRE